MSEFTTSETVPFETNSNGNYVVTAPFKDCLPKEMTITTDNGTYRFWGNAGKDVTSNQFPEVIAYKYCERVDVEYGDDE
jgi:hypothetical protein